MFALLGNLDFLEILVIGAGALMVFGKRLPEVAMRLATHVARLRRSVAQVWREAGMEEELRKVRRTIEQELPRTPHPAQHARRAMHEIQSKIQSPPPPQREEPQAAEPSDEGEAGSDDGPDNTDRESA